MQWKNVAELETKEATPIATASVSSSRIVQQGEIVSPIRLLSVFELWNVGKFSPLGLPTFRIGTGIASNGQCGRTHERTEN